MQDIIKWSNIHLIGVPEKKERLQSRIFEEITNENFPKNNDTDPRS